MHFGALGTEVSASLGPGVRFPGQQGCFQVTLRNRCRRSPGTSPSAWTRGPFRFLRKLVAQDEAEEGTTFSLFVEAGLGMGPAKPLPAAAMPCVSAACCSAESSGLVWPPRACLVSQGDNDRQEGGVRRAGWEVPSGKPSFESTFFSKPQTRLPK